jgi:predicted metal-dependent phosphoesterase TrpH
MTRRFVDLHTHTTASDGSLTPTELIDAADRVKLAAIAVTDHDTVAGLAEARAAAADYPELDLAVGVEVSATFPGGTMHLLGLGIDETNEQLLAMLNQLSEGRTWRNPEIVRRLNALGLELTYDEVLAIAHSGSGSSAVSRNHIAEALIARGYVKTRQEAFNKYLASGGPAYVSRVKLDPAETIAAIRAAGGLAVLCHPPQLKCENGAQLERIMRELMDAGLEAIEAYHSDCTARQKRHYLDLAKQLKLFVTGGSDFHGRGKPDVHLGHPRVPASLIPPELAERIYE